MDVDAAVLGGLLRYLSHDLSPRFVENGRLDYQKYQILANVALQLDLQDLHQDVQFLFKSFHRVPVDAVAFHDAWLARFRV